MKGGKQGRKQVIRSKTKETEKNVRKLKTIILKVKILLSGAMIEQLRSVNVVTLGLRVSYRWSNIDLFCFVINSNVSAVKTFSLKIKGTI